MLNLKDGLREAPLLVLFLATIYFGCMACGVVFGAVR